MLYAQLGSAYSVCRHERLEASRVARTQASARITVLPRYRRRGLWVGSVAAVAGCVLGGIAIPLLDNLDSRLFAGSVAGILLVLSAVIYRLSFSWVVADHAGIRRSRLIGSVLIPWTDVRDIVIGTVYDQYRYRWVRSAMRFGVYNGGAIAVAAVDVECILVVTGSGRRHLLPVPYPARSGSNDVAVLQSSYSLLCRLWRRHPRHQID